MFLLVLTTSTLSTVFIVNEQHGISVIGGAIQVGDFAALIQYAIMILMSMIMLVMVLVMITMAIESASRINKVLTTKSTLVSPENGVKEVSDGSIEFDGIDIRKFDLKSLRDNISFVFQDNFLFSGTIRDNIMMGNEGAAEEELDRAIEMAHLDEFIDALENGLDTVVGERGTTLSGGQRQRVAIARAILKDAPIVILDEATSALDNKSEAIVQKALDNLIKNKTVFVIAHRLSTIKNADRIAVINDGELAELGTHDQLMMLPDGIYRKLYEMQFQNNQEEAVV